MGLISAKTILTSLSLFHITLAFFFLTNPHAVADQAVVYLLGESMGLPHSRSFESQSPTLAFLAFVLLFLGLSDLTTLSLPDEIALLQHWPTQAPLRLTLSFALTLYSFFFSASSPLFYTSTSADESTAASGGGLRMGHPSAHHAAHHSVGYSPSGWGGDALKNRVFFTFVFVETISWLWVWVTLQEEQKEIVARTQRARRRGSGARYVEK